MMHMGGCRSGEYYEYIGGFMIHGGSYHEYIGGYSVRIKYSNQAPEISFISCVLLNRKSVLI